MRPWPHAAWRPVISCTLFCTFAPDPLETSVADSFYRVFGCKHVGSVAARSQTVVIVCRIPRLKRSAKPTSQRCHLDPHQRPNQSDLFQGSSRALIFQAVALIQSPHTRLAVDGLYKSQSPSILGSALNRLPNGSNNQIYSLQTTRYMTRTTGLKWDHKQSLKEIVRHGLYRSGTYRLLDNLRRLKGIETGHLDHWDRRTRFEKIYELGAWIHSEDQVAASGKGSELETTEGLRSSLPGLLRDLKVQTLVDVGCGDWTWMSKLELPCNYLGLDIVENVVERNRAAYSKPGVDFRRLDAVAEPIPDCNAVLCREVIFHLSFVDGLELIKNIKRHSEWLIITTDTTIWFNSDIPSGDFRMLNLECRPFRFPRPERELRDDGFVSGRRLSVWRTASLP